MRTVQGSNFCVLGGAGFLGSHAVEHLIEDKKCNVLVIDNLVAGRREFIHPKAKFIHHDITGSEEYLKQIFLSHKIQFVGNWIAYPYIPDSFARPLHVFNVNAMGALKVINAAQEAGVEGILQVSSAEIFGEGDGIVNPHSSYGASKAAIDYLCQVRWREAKTPVIALRQFNCIGERETHPYVVTTIIEQMVTNEQSLKPYDKEGIIPKIKLGNNSFRDFQYAGDAVRMAVELLEKGQSGEVYNMGSEEGIKIYELARKIGKLMGFADVEIVEDESRKRPWEIWHLQSDNSKLYSVIETRPKVSLDEALLRTIKYFRSNGNKWCWQ